MTQLEGHGITAAGAYIPVRRIARTTIAAAHAWAIPDLQARSAGQRAFANWDEDSITMSVEAVRNTASVGQRSLLQRVFLASTTLPFADRHNAAILAAALNLPQTTFSLDIGGSQRAGTSALRVALDTANCGPAMVVAADRRAAKPGSVQELLWADAAAAIATGCENVIARFLGSASVTRDFVDHFREAGSDYDYFWEERWIRDEGFLKIIPEAILQVVQAARIDPAQVRHLILPIADLKASRAIAQATGVSTQAVVDNLESAVGLAGAAHSLLMLVKALEQAQPGEIILVAGFGQGCDVLAFQATEKILQWRPKDRIDEFIRRGRPENNYMKFLSFSTKLPFEWGMRAELDTKTALTAQYRNSAMITGFMAGRCRQTGLVQFPKSRISVEPGHYCVDTFEDYPLADEPARVMSFAADWLAYSPAPPCIYGHVQFDVGARLMMEFADADADVISVGMPLRMVFRIKEFDSKRNYRRYFWKASPAYVEGG